MRHARKDYDNRFVDQLGKIPEDEPVFFLRGQDTIAAKAVDHYADELEKAGGDPKMVALARGHAKQMRAYAKKLPDMPSDAIPTEGDILA